MKSIHGFFLSGIGYKYSIAGDIRPLVDYLRRELKDPDAADFIAKVLMGEIKKGDGRGHLSKRGMTQSQSLAMSFDYHRGYADYCEKEHGATPVTDAQIYAGLDNLCGYCCGTAARMISRYRKKREQDTIQK